MSFLAYVFAFAAGSFIAIQAGSNSQLKKSLEAPMPAIIVNYLVGLSGVVLYALIKRDPLPPMSRAELVPWWAWLGGLFGAVYGLAVVYLASQMGAATLTALVLAGQLICSVALDHFGWVGFDPHPAGIGRLAGCAFLIFGLILISKF